LHISMVFSVICLIYQCLNV